MPKRRDESEAERKKREKKQRERRSRGLLGSGIAGKAADVLTRRRAMLEGL